MPRALDTPAKYIRNRIPLPKGLAGAATTVISQFKKFYGNAADEAVFLRRWYARERLFAKQTRDYEPIFHRSHKSAGRQVL